MTDETMPREIIVEPDGDDIIIHTDQDLINNPACQKYLHKYVHHTTHEAALQALEVAREVLRVSERKLRIIGETYDGDKESRKYAVIAKQALEQINDILENKYE